jgi:8-oxo-dGTP diphosphatase
MLNNVKFVQKALIKKDGEYLFIKRSTIDENRPGKWDLPGGNIDRGENTIEALSREISEEVKIKCSNIKPLITTSFTQEGDVFVMAVIYEADYKEGAVEISEEHSEYKWVSKEDIKNLDLQDWMVGLI